MGGAHGERVGDLRPLLLARVITPGSQAHPGVIPLKKTDAVGDLAEFAPISTFPASVRKRLATYFHSGIPPRSA